MSYDVSTAVFEGPFDLLLHLILREQVDIHEVSLSTIVDAYLTEIEKMQDLDLDIATEFLLIASTLVELKARRLLPGKENIDLLLADLLGRCRPLASLGNLDLLYVGLVADRIHELVVALGHRTCARLLAGCVEHSGIISELGGRLIILARFVQLD